MLHHARLLCCSLMLAPLLAGAAPKRTLPGADRSFSALYVEFLSRCAQQRRFPLDCSTLRSMWQPVAEIARATDNYRGLYDATRRDLFEHLFPLARGRTLTSKPRSDGN